MFIEWFSLECRKTKTKVITLANHKEHTHKGGSRILKWGVNFCNNVREIRYYLIFEGYEKKERRWLRKRGVKIHPFHLPWIRAWHNTVNRSKLEVIAGSWSKARRNACEWVTIGFGLTCDCMKIWREFFEPIV